MKFLIDAQLPRRMVGWFAAAGCDAFHTFDLPLRNQTPDKDVIEYADRQQQIRITKDGDFVDSHLLSGQPAKMLIITTGNISNLALEQLLIPFLPAIVAEFRQHAFLEFGRSGLIVRE